MTLVFILHHNQYTNKYNLKHLVTYFTNSDIFTNVFAWKNLKNALLHIKRLRKITRRLLFIAQSLILWYTFNVKLHCNHKFTESPLAKFFLETWFFSVTLFYFRYNFKNLHYMHLIFGFSIPNIFIYLSVFYLKCIVSHEIFLHITAA